LNLLPINIDKFSTMSESLYAIASLSLKYNLTSYDASYLELAIRMNAMIATLDKNLILACNLANVKVY
jgi:predicted nucleic acid-binding protein